jgi:hypothetical protein
MLGCWDVPSHVAVRQDVLKLSRDAWSWELPPWLGVTFHPGAPDVSSE